MIALFCCQCATSELKARRVLKSAGIKNYLGIRCYLGKTSINLALDNMPEQIKQTTEWAGLRRMINEKASYSVIAGWDNVNFRWSNVYTGEIEDVVPGEQIAEYFAEIS